MILKRWMPLLLALMLLTLTACGGGGKEGEESKEPEGTPLPPQILELGDRFQTNVKDGDGAYVFCKISLEAVSEEDLAVLSANVPRLRDIVNSILRAKSLEELQQDNAQEILRNDIIEQVKTAFSLEDLKGVYFEGYFTAS